MSQAGKRVPIWASGRFQNVRRKQIARFTVFAIACVAIVGVGFLSYRDGGWPSVFDWAVVAIPAIAGIILAVLPIRVAELHHRLWLAVGCFALAALTWLQQRQTRADHAREISQLPGHVAEELKREGIGTITKSDINEAISRVSKVPIASTSKEKKEFVASVAPLSVQQVEAAVKRAMPDLPAAAQQVSFGDLAERIDNEADKMHQFFVLRKQSENMYLAQLPADASPQQHADKMLMSLIATSDHFRFQYQSDLISIRDEAAALHIRNVYLDQDIASILASEKSNDEAAAQNPSMRDRLWTTNLATILGIETSLRQLAQQVRRVQTNSNQRP